MKFFLKKKLSLIFEEKKFIILDLVQFTTLSPPGLSQIFEEKKFEKKILKKMFEKIFENFFEIFKNKNLA